MELLLAILAVVLMHVPLGFFTCCCTKPCNPSGGNDSFTDDFSSNTMSCYSRVNDGCAIGTWTITGGQLVGPTSPPAGTCRQTLRALLNSFTITGKTIAMSVKIYNVTSTTGSYYVGPSAGTNPFPYLVFFPDQAGNNFFMVSSAGAYVAHRTVANGDELKLEFVEDGTSHFTLNCYHNGTLVATHTSTSNPFTGTFYAALSTDSYFANAATFDDWKVEITP